MQTMTEQELKERRKGAVRTATFLFLFCLALLIAFVVSVSMKQRKSAPGKTVDKTAVNTHKQAKTANQ